MSQTDNLNIIIGYSGHSYVVIESAFEANIHISGYIDRTMAAKNPYNLKYAGFENSPSFRWDKDINYILGIGDNRIRKQIMDLLNEENLNVLTIIHPNSDISKTVEIQHGTFVSSGAQLNALVSIGAGVIINTGSIIEHQCDIGDYVHVAPGAVLAGNVSVGNGSFIGANSVIKEGVVIGQNVVVGAGTVVLEDVADNIIIVGNPGKILIK